MTYEAEAGNITMAVVGDAMLTRRLSVFREERFIQLAELMRNADCAYANLEMLFHDYEGYADVNSYTHTRSDPSHLDELKWLGIDLVSFSNNHTLDFGYDGMLATMAHLKRVGITFSGAGLNLQEARSPAYFDTSRGRVGLISATSTFPPHWRAGEQRPDMKGRPGANCLAFQTAYTVDRQAIEDLARISTKLGFEEHKHYENTQGYFGPVFPDGDTRFHFLDHGGGVSIKPAAAVFELGDDWGATTKCDKRDLEQNLKWVRAATRQADLVVVSLHTHERGDDLNMPADFAQEFARACIDAGAHAVVGHGPHFLRGIEIYKGRPIFYSLGNFIFQLETLQRFPQESYDRLDLGYQATAADFMWKRYGGEQRSFPSEPKFWRSVLGIIEWEGWDVKGVRLYPLDLGFGHAWGQRGRPVLADAVTSREILERLQDLSRPYNTKIDIRDSMGIVRP